MAFCERIFFGLVGITLAALAGCESKAGTNPPAETKIITSAGDSCGARSGAFASCPAGFELVEGGYHLVSWDQRALSGRIEPLVSEQDGRSQAWHVMGSGPVGNACFSAYAVCRR